MKWRLSRKVGYFSNKNLSGKLRYAAISEATVLQFADPVCEPEMGVKVLTEDGVQTKLIPPKIKLTEVGRAIQLTPSSIPYSHDPQDPIQKHLIWQLRNALDRCCMAALKLKQGSVDIITSATVLKSIIPRAKWTGIESLCGIASGYMCSRAEPYNRTHYIGIGGVRFLRAVERHPKFLQWKKYLVDGDELFIGEMGSTNNIRWVRFNDTSLLENNEAVVLGHQGLLLKEVQTPELRLSRLQDVIAWYGILAFGSQNVLHIPERKRRWA